jgi:PTH1 family peptidyl-tRNA hydrolase
MSGLAVVVGLGNPGPEYEFHRHNIGFRVVDALAGTHGLRFSLRMGKARVAQGTVDGREVVLVKPRTYMNLSGQAVSRVCRELVVAPERLLIVYDDLDLPLGRLRLRPEGGSGGHKGMRSIIHALGTQSFARLRVGIGRPPGRMDPAEYVLRPFEEEEQPLVAEAVERAVAAVEYWLAEDVVAAMDRFNQPANTENGVITMEGEPGLGSLAKNSTSGTITHSGEESQS